MARDLRALAGARCGRHLFIAAISGISIFHSGAFRSLLNQALPAQQELIPASFLTAYGIYITAMLAFTYLPAHKTLTEVGELLANRQAVRVYLGLQGSALQEIQKGIAVLVPFLPSISSLILGASG